MSIGSMQGRIAPAIGTGASFGDSSSGDLSFGDLGAGAIGVSAPVLAPVLARALARALTRALATALLALLVDATCAVAQENACAAHDPRQACSYQCCGRRSCPPSCEVDCVKLCVDACGSQTRSLAYDSRKRDLQLRCGNKGAR